MENIVKTDYIAKALDVTPAHVSLLIRQGEINAQKFGSVWAIDKAEADKFIKDYLADPPKVGRNPQHLKRKKRPD